MATRTLALRHARDIRSVFAGGVALHGRTMVLHVRDRDDTAPTRWTVVAGRKVGGAVRRNRAKRRLRAAVASSVLPVGLDVVVVAREPAGACPFDDLVAEFRALAARAQRPGVPRKEAVR